MNDLRGHIASTVLLALVASGATIVAQESAPARRDFVIGIEDRLKIDVWKHGEVSLTAKVRPDGMITVPLAGDILADGRTPAALAEDIKSALAAYIKDPVVTVIVEEIKHYKIYVLGEIGNQGVIELTRPTRLLEAIAQSGGLTPFADKSNVNVVRYEGGREVRIRVDYRKLINGQQPELNMELKPGDMILVR
jgi:polysaccharide export outer membrane protein